MNSAARSRPHGFTLLKLLVVVVIIGLLVGYVAPRYFGQVGKSEVTTAKAQIDALEKALDQYRLDVGRYPTTELGLAALVNRPANEPKWNGPYLRKDVPLDPCARPTCTSNPANAATTTSSPSARTASRGEPAKTPTSPTTRAAPDDALRAQGGQPGGTGRVARPARTRPGERGQAGREPRLYRARRARPRGLLRALER